MAEGGPISRRDERGPLTTINNQDIMSAINTALFQQKALVPIRIMNAK
jgi:hypothetical protein